MCFNFCFTILEVISLMAPWLSHLIGTGPSEIVIDIIVATSCKMRLIQRLFRVTCKHGMYSASSVERATTLWDLACQWISPDMSGSGRLESRYPRLKTQPPTDLRVLVLPAQSESV